MEIDNTPEARAYFEYSYPELCAEVGKERGNAILEHCLKMSKLYSDKPSLLHECNLITTFLNPEASVLERKCSVFKYPISAAPKNRKQKQLTIWQVADLIRSDKFKKETDHLRTLKGKEANSLYKQKGFCYALFSGTFSDRDKNSLIQHSGLICLDLDHLNERLEEVRGIVNADTWTVMSFTSPNGDGLKVLYEIDTTVTQGENYAGLSKRLRKLCDLESVQIDKSCKDLSRACFLPHDPALFINPHFVKS